LKDQGPGADWAAPDFLITGSEVLVDLDATGSADLLTIQGRLALGEDLLIGFNPLGALDES
jgi:hypothetical protein